MSLYGIIGDAHLGFKAYDSTRRTEECIWVFEQAVGILYNAGVRTMYFPGDLLDDTVISNWVEKRLLFVLRTYPDVKFVFLGGNHDSTKTYSSVSALDVLAERSNVVVINDFVPAEFVIDGLNVLAVPHAKSQREFKESIMSLSGSYDVCLLHAMVCSKLDLGPNDLNIDEEMIAKLEKHCRHTWIGHQHNPVIMSDRMTITGSTMELNFGELGPRYVYIVNDGEVSLRQIPQPRSMERIDVIWSGINDLLDRLHDLDRSTIYKVVASGVPPTEYSACLAAIESVCRGFEGDLVYDVIKVGHEEVNIGTIDVGFDLVQEFQMYCEENGHDFDGNIGYLTDAMAAVAAEEEDAV